MGNVLNLNKYRKGRRKDWLDRHSTQLDRFMSKYIAVNLSIDFFEVYSLFQNQHHANSEECWDYSEFRERIRDAIDGLIGDALYRELQAQWWFDGTWISKEDAIDRCLSSYILGSLRSVAGD